MDFIYTEVKENNIVRGYYSIPNVKGLTNSDDINLLYKKNRIKFDELMIKKISKSDVHNVFMQTSLQAIENIINTNEDILNQNKITFIIDDASENNPKVYNYLKECGHDICVSIETLRALPIEFLNKKIINGVFNIEENS